MLLLIKIMNVRFLMFPCTSLHLMFPDKDFSVIPGEVLTEFLNATLQSPMPISSCMAVLKFLDIVDAGVMPISMKPTRQSQVCP